MISEHFFTDRSELFAALATDCQQRLTDAVTRNGKASLLVSGGSTPKPLYQRLADAQLAWAKVSIALVDERWVAPGEVGSNESFIRQTLLHNLAAAASYIPTKNNHITAQGGLSGCEAAYRQLPRPFDLTILGMGPDGHTASLFPQAHGLESALNIENRQLCASIIAHRSEVTGELIERMTLSLYGLLQSRQLHLLITGNDKLEVYQAARASSDVAATPISAVLQQQQVPVIVYWAP